MIIFKIVVVLAAIFSLGLIVFVASCIGYVVSEIRENKKVGK